MAIYLLAIFQTDRYSFIQIKGGTSQVQDRINLIKK